MHQGVHFGHFTIQSVVHHPPTGLTTFGDDREEAVTRAAEALEEAIAARIHNRRNIPPPSGAAAYAILPTLTSVKVMLYQSMRDQGITCRCALYACD